MIVNIAVRMRVQQILAELLGYTPDVEYTDKGWMYCLTGKATFAGKTIHEVITYADAVSFEQELDTLERFVQGL